MHKSSVSRPVREEAAARSRFLAAPIPARTTRSLAVEKDWKQPTCPVSVGLTRRGGSVCKMYVWVWVRVRVWMSVWAWQWVWASCVCVSMGRSGFASGEAGGATHSHSHIHTDTHKQARQ